MVPLAASAQSQTAQSMMVNFGALAPAYEIEGTITWRYDRDTAETYYANVWDGNPPVVTAGTGNSQTSPGVPLPDANKLTQHAQSQRCTFFHGGSLAAAATYTQVVNGTRGWKWTYTYTLTPVAPGTVGTHTAWSSETTGGTVTIPVGGFIASESFLRQANGRTKYSFTLTDSLGASRVADVSATLQKSDGAGNWPPVDMPLAYAGQLPITIATADFGYTGNAGVFGSSSVASFLHTGSPMPVKSILASDSFDNNDFDLEGGNVHTVLYGGTAGVDQFVLGPGSDGAYRLSVAGTAKGNAGTAAQAFATTSNVTQIGGCASGS
jgi:hypothetical protein